MTKTSSDQSVNGNAVCKHQRQCRAIKQKVGFDPNPTRHFRFLKQIIITLFLKQLKRVDLRLMVLENTAFSRATGAFRLTF